MRNIIFVLAFCVASICIQDNARAQLCTDPSTCLYAWNWTSRSTIPVYIHPELALNLVHDDGTQWTDDEIEREIQALLASLQEHLASNAPRFVYSGFLSFGGSDDAYVPYAVTINPWMHQCTGEDAGTCDCFASAETSVANNDLSHGIVVHLKRSGTGIIGGIERHLADCGKHWEHHRTTYDGVTTTRGALNHEFLHVLGLGHYGSADESCPQDCVCAGGGSCSMTEDEGKSYLWSNPYRYDIERVQHIYGTFPTTTSYRKITDGTTDGLTWTDASNTTMPASTPLVGTSSTAGAYEMFGIRSVTTMVPALWRYQPSRTTWVNLGAPSSISPSYGQVGAADDDSGTWRSFLAWLKGETVTNTTDTPSIAERTSSAWTITYNLNNWPIVYQGISIAHDPKYDEVVMAYRDSSARVTIQAFNAGAPGPSYTIAGAYSDDPPIVACGANPPTYNCVVTWASAPTGPGTRTLTWMHFYVDAGLTITNTGPVVSGGYVMFGSPSVAYIGGTQCPWLFAWNTLGSTYYTKCKDSAIAATLTAGTEVSHTWTGDAASPRVGAAPGAFELFNYRR
jgi:hypothetical protein